MSSAQEHLQVVRALWDSVEPDADHARSRERHVCRSAEGACPELPRPLLQRARTIAGAAVAPGPPRDHSGRAIGPGHGSRRAITPTCNSARAARMPSMKAHRAELDGRLAQVRTQAARLRHPLVGAHPGSRVGREGTRRWSSATSIRSPRKRADRALLDVRARLLAVCAATCGWSMSPHEVKAQNVHWGSFEEILKTTDPNLTVEQFGRKFMTERILVAAGTPKMIVDKLEQWHFETGANGGFMLLRGLIRAGQPAGIRGPCRAGAAAARPLEEKIRGLAIARQSAAVRAMFDMSCRVGKGARQRMSVVGTMVRAPCPRVLSAWAKPLLHRAHDCERSGRFCPPYALRGIDT